MYGNRSLAHTFVWESRRILQLSPMQALFRKLKARGLAIETLDALEMFGADGRRHTLDYRSKVHSLDIWELDTKYLTGLRQSFSDDQIRITDTYQELLATTKTYDLLVEDSPGHLYGPNREYCEHFDLLSDYLFRVARPSTVIILTVVPQPLRQIPTARQLPTFTRHMQRRKQFYGTNDPENVPVETMIPGYRRVLEANGFALEWHVSVRRTLRSGVYYLALKVRRSER